MTADLVKDVVLEQPQHVGVARFVPVAALPSWGWPVHDLDKQACTHEAIAGSKGRRAVLC